jgi:transketolase
VRVVSVISEGLFRQQALEYQASVIPGHLPTFGLTAGLPVTLAGLVGARGKIWGLDHFGYSAPAKVLDEKLGFTPANVCNQVVKYLADYHKSEIAPSLRAPSPSIRPEITS